MIWYTVQYSTVHFKLWARIRTGFNADQDPDKDPKFKVNADPVPDQDPDLGF